MFVVGAALYGTMAGVGMYMGDIPTRQAIFTVVGAVLLGGYMMAAIFASILLCSRYLSEKSLRFKQVASILFMFTYMAAVAMGFICVVPVFIKCSRYLKSHE